MTKRRRSSRGGVDAPPRPGLVLPGRELRGPDGWPALFGRSADLVVEIGCGYDPFLLERAAAHPHQDHVGVERDLGRAEALAESVADAGLDNVRVLSVSAELALGSCFGDGALRELHVYFPDPWPKERHAWNRLVRPWFAQDTARVLGPGGLVFTATDDLPYAAQMRDVFAAAGFRLLSVDESARHETRTATDVRRSGVTWSDSGVRGGSDT